VISEAAYERLDAIRSRRVFLDRLVGRPERYVLACRTSALPELEDAGLLLDADAIWSMWEGYLTQPSSAEIIRTFRRNGVVLTCLHASGHATVDDLQRLVRDMRPRRVVPIHTACPERYADLFEDVEIHPDGEWWAV
jgi:ribonuclease J